ncbi:hypothetical protein DIS24_g3947 [Lasiodiplodia hormozganensis]|uniref:Uncharacterized protein n=1 Tax=Lasiodiplodia hormozganensis TaxID=869390 RepID=A0AA40D454_9PEZI|nr:hypothetical protein DIS24_g3947 [Lasiodiplodia hormozganensis]
MSSKTGHTVIGKANVGHREDPRLDAASKDNDSENCSQNHNAPTSTNSKNKTVIATTTSRLLSLPPELRQLIFMVLCTSLCPLRLCHTRALSALPETPTHHRADYASTHLSTAEKRAYAEIRGLSIVCSTFQQDLLRVESIWFTRRFALNLGDFAAWVDEAAASLAAQQKKEEEEEEEEEEKKEGEEKDSEGTTKGERTKDNANSYVAPPAPRRNIHITLLLFDEPFVRDPPPAYRWLVTHILPILFDEDDTATKPSWNGTAPRTGATAYTRAWVTVLRKFSPALAQRLGIRGVDVANMLRMAREDQVDRIPGTTDPVVGNPPLIRVAEGRPAPERMVAYLKAMLVGRLGLSSDRVWMKREDYRGQKGGWI